MGVREHFFALAPRERLLIALAVALALIAVVVLGIVRPLTQGRQALETQLDEKRAILSDIERVAARFGKAGGAAAAAAQGGSESLVVLMDRTTRNRGLSAYLRHNEPDGANGIRLRFENVSFDDLLGWLGELQSVYAVSVANASADPVQEPGRVNASLQLSRAPRH